MIVDNFDDVELDDHVEGDEDVMPSARIVNENVDGALDFNFNNHPDDIIIEEVEESYDFGQKDNIEDADDEEGEGEDDVVLFIEYKYCTICHIE